MAFVAKTNWQTNDTVMPQDMNRLEQGIYDASFIFTQDGTIKYKWVVEDGQLFIEEV